MQQQPSPGKYAKYSDTAAISRIIRNYTTYNALIFANEFIKRNESILSTPTFSIDKDIVEDSQKIDLWNLALNERIFYRFFDYHKFSDEEIMKIEENSIKFFQRVLDEVKPDYFLTKQPSFHHLELFRIMCENHNCKVIMMSFPKIAYRMLISKNVTELDYTNKLEKYPITKKSFQDLPFSVINFYWHVLHSMAPRYFDKLTLQHISYIWGPPLILFSQVFH